MIPTSAFFPDKFQILLLTNDIHKKCKSISDTSENCTPKITVTYLLQNKFDKNEFSYIKTKPQNPLPNFVTFVLKTITSFVVFHCTHKSRDYKDT